VTTEPADPPRLYRASDGRLVAGVARGISDHLDVPVAWVRLTFVVLTLLGGAGVLMYGALWLFVPVQHDLPGQPSAPIGQWRRPARRSNATPALLLSLAAIVFGIIWLLQSSHFVPQVTTPLVLLLVGAALLWLRSDEVSGLAGDTRTGARDAKRRPAWLPLVLGGALVLIGALGVLATQASWLEAGRVLVAGLIVTVGVALLAAPWVIAVFRDRDDERRARIRSEERADIAAHVHDSVLQTLTLIQRNAQDPAAVARLARAQERDLRRWLYEPDSQQSNTLRAALEAVAAEVEDQHGVLIDLVCVADAPLDERLTALVQAAREAMVNAAKYAGQAGAISVFAEVDASDVTVFVRDRGPGFDLDALPEDRRGVRDSILGRVERNGGTARIVTGDGEGTQVELHMAVAQ
jgi:signal transduction histidine kinase/phage shock protein PspC (stress-responsive transcriptional regulator)